VRGFIDRYTIFPTGSSHPGSGRIITEGAGHRLESAAENLRTALRVDAAATVRQSFVEHWYEAVEDVRVATARCGPLHAGSRLGLSKRIRFRLHQGVSVQSWTRTRRRRPAVCGGGGGPLASIIGPVGLKIGRLHCVKRCMRRPGGRYGATERCSMVACARLRWRRALVLDRPVGANAGGAAEGALVAGEESGALEGVAHRCGDRVVG